MSRDETPEASDFREMAAVWAHAALLQIDRYQRSIAQFVAAEFDPDEITRAVKLSRGRIPHWIQHMPRGRTRITNASVLRIGIERYFLLLALAQLAKCVNQLSDDNLPRFSWGNEVITLIRNVEEHWDDPVGRSLTKLASIASSRAADEQRSLPTAVRLEAVDWGELLWSTGPTIMDVKNWVEDVDRTVRLRAKRDHMPIRDSDELV